MLDRTNFWNRINTAPAPVLSSADDPIGHHSTLILSVPFPLDAVSYLLCIHHAEASFTCCAAPHLIVHHSSSYQHPNLTLQLCKNIRMPMASSALSHLSPHHIAVSIVSNLLRLLYQLTGRGICPLHLLHTRKRIFSPIMKQRSLYINLCYFVQYLRVVAMTRHPDQVDPYV